MIRLVMIAIAIIWSVGPVNAIIGYDCESRDAEVKTIALNDYNGCEAQAPDLDTGNTQIQLIQQIANTDVDYETCLIRYTQLSYRCFGAPSFNSMTNRGISEGFIDVSREECTEMLSKGEFKLPGGRSLTRLARGYNHATMTYKGQVGSDGYCTGESFSDNGVEYEHTAAIRSYTVFLQKGTGTYDIKEGKYITRRGTRCQKDNSCFSGEEGHIFFNTEVERACTEDKHVVLYQGPALKVISGKMPDLYVVNDTEQRFALTSSTPFNLCGRKVWKTGHTDLFIAQRDEVMGWSFDMGSSRSPGGKNVMLSAYTNSKIIYFEWNLSGQLDDLWTLVQTSTCQTNEQVLKDQLSIGATNPEEFAYTYNDYRPGMSGVKMGEVIYLFRCAAVGGIVLRSTDQCYDDIPVTWKNESWFLTPRTHILSRTGKTVPCVSAMPPMHRIDGTWVSMERKSRTGAHPDVLTAEGAGEWSYKRIGNWNKIGIYTEEDIQHLQENMMFGHSIDSVQVNMARAAGGENTDRSGWDFGSAITVDEAKKIVVNGADLMFRVMVEYGTYLAIFWAVFWTLRVISGLCGCGARMKLLHQAEGRGWHLIRACCTGTTLLFLIGRTMTDMAIGRKPPPYNAPYRQTTAITEQPKAPSESGDDETNIMLGNIGDRLQRLNAGSSHYDSV